MEKRDEAGSLENQDGVSRRDFFKTGAVGLGAAALVGSSGCTEVGEGAQAAPGANTGTVPSLVGTAPALPLTADPIEVVRIGFVGVGGMGTAHIRNLARIEGCVITAVCDVNEVHAERAADLIVEAGHPRPTLYTRGELDYERLCAEADVDLVYTATPWRYHVPVCVAAMENGKHAATEIPASYTLDGCWELVETAERTGRHCVMMENCTYNRPELLCLSLVRAGLLGEVLHAECGYLHDLRGIKFSEDGEGMWRRDHAWTRNGNLYPTHGLGPVASCMNINRGDQYGSIVSMSGPSVGLQDWARENYPEGHAKRNETFALGDVNVSIIKTVMGKTIYISHDTNLPRPYSRINMVQGSKGIFQGYPDRVYIEGRSPAHAWEDAATYYEEFEHPLWKALQEESIGAGHGGMDFMEDYRLIRCLRDGLPTDQNVYDGASMSAVCELSELSVAAGGAPLEFPDFTRGRWREWAPWALVGA